jgi:SAM-dependent methyltransferase
MSSIDAKMDGMRQLVKNYWCAAHVEPTLENMLLDSNATTIDVFERPEVLSKLPCVRGLRVLELGAGIGRFTKVLADGGCKELLAVDFLEAACESNRSLNAANTRVQVLCQDATTLQFPHDRFDFIFSNWLLMYLSDDEVNSFFRNSIKWLKPGGSLFFRESCMHKSGDVARSFNPSRYRHPDEYFRAAADAGDGESGFNCLDHGRISTYVTVKNNPNQFYWTLKKCSLNACSPPTPVAGFQSGGSLFAEERHLVVLLKPASNLYEFLSESCCFVHVVALQNTLGLRDFQALSHKTRFSYDVVNELPAVAPFLPRVFDAAYFHGKEGDSLALRTFVFRMARWMKTVHRVHGLSEEEMLIFQTVEPY